MKENTPKSVLFLRTSWHFWSLTHWRLTARRGFGYGLVLDFEGGAERVPRGGELV